MKQINQVRAGFSIAMAMAALLSVQGLVQADTAGGGGVLVTGGSDGGVNASQVESGAPTSTEYLDFKLVGKSCNEWRKANSTKPSSGSPPKISVATTNYPDIWSYLPDTSLGERLGHMVLLPDGDIGLEIWHSNNDEIRFQRMFFRKPLTLDDQCRIHNLVDASKLFNTKLIDGKVVDTNYGHGRTDAGMPYEIKLYSDEFHQDAQHVATRKYILYKSDKSLDLSKTGMCEKEYVGQLLFDHTFAGIFLANLIALPDGGVVAANLMPSENDGPPIAIRFDGNMKTKSTVIADKIFVTDSAPDCYQKYCASIECIHQKLDQVLSNMQQGAQP